MKLTLVSMALAQSLALVSLAALAQGQKAIPGYPSGGTTFGGYPGFNQPFGAPGAVRGGYGYQGVAPYYMRNQPGVGFYSPNPLSPVYPAWSAPQPIGGAVYGIASGSNRFTFWKSPSGYYYPWLSRSYYGVPAPIIVIQQGVSTPAQPPLSTVFGDLRKFLDESKSQGKLTESDYSHLSLRLKDLMSKESMYRGPGGTTLDEGVEADLRKDLDQLGEEISRRVKS